jgi:hypothetical protein
VTVLTYSALLHPQPVVAAHGEHGQHQGDRSCLGYSDRRWKVLESKPAHR